MTAILLAIMSAIFLVAAVVAALDAYAESRRRNGDPCTSRDPRVARTLERLSQARADMEARGVPHFFQRAWRKP